ncbi:hypothetical protein M752DRAFT_275420 [Aspergillus phoenicis ATCC 13157]|uniref:Uncharacterized protein n=1 Tax=Aspergillus phoenicis ATCC 13157 TaxID=1353007 RepID=A0A370PLU4_ASPPH|nr:hypothetical protein M752DRAFT_275420 [Aspergillus phoenicis ATCC 13157]
MVYGGHGSQIDYLCVPSYFPVHSVWLLLRGTFIVQLSSVPAASHSLIGKKKRKSIGRWRVPRYFPVSRLSVFR